MKRKWPKITLPPLPDLKIKFSFARICFYLVDWFFQQSKELVFSVRSMWIGLVYLMISVLLYYVNKEIGTDTLYPLLKWFGMTVENITELWWETTVALGYLGWVVFVISHGFRRKTYSVYPLSKNSKEDVVAGNANWVYMLYVVAGLLVVAVFDSNTVIRAELAISVILQAAPFFVRDQFKEQGEYDFLIIAAALLILCGSAFLLLS